jgi:hypothetical protein
MTEERNQSYDVFLSHNSADKPIVEMLATRLQDEASLVLFLDKWHLVPGEPWQEALEKALDESATCAVFLGPSGLGSWENEEMRSALEDRVRKKRFRVIPVLLPGADPKDSRTLPRFLHRVTWVDFRSGIDDAETFHRLVAGIRGETPGRGRTKAVHPQPQAGILKRLYQLLTKPLVLLILPTLLLAGVTMSLQRWRLPTRIDISLYADRAHFRIGGRERVLILNSVGFQSLTVEKFSRITFSPAKLEAADPAMYMPFEDRFYQSAWKLISMPSPCVVTPLSERLMPSVTLEGVNSDASAGTLDRLRAEPESEVTLEVRGTGRDVTAQLEGKEPVAAVSFKGSFQLITNAAVITGIQSGYAETESATYRARLSDSRPEIEVVGQPADLTLVLSVSPNKTHDLFPREAIPVTALDFTRQEETGNRVSALVNVGEISYPDFPSLPKAAFHAPDLIGLNQLEGFRIEKIALDPATKGLWFRLNGIAGHIWTGSREFVRDHRLTSLEVLWGNSVMLVVLLIMMWMLPTTAAGYRLYRDLQTRRQ